jgi:hypothetical protein
LAVTATGGDWNIRPSGSDSITDVRGKPFESIPTPKRAPAIVTVAPGTPKDVLADVTDRV